MKYTAHEWLKAHEVTPRKASTDATDSSLFVDKEDAREALVFLRAETVGTSIQVVPRHSKEGTGGEPILESDGKNPVLLKVTEQGDYVGRIDLEGTEKYITFMTITKGVCAYSLFVVLLNFSRLPVKQDNEILFNIQ